jgi:RNA methyltransferase, TrmH family
MSVEELRRLHDRAHRESQRRYLIEGEHLVLELQKAAQRDPRLLAAELYVSHEYPHRHEPFATHVLSARQIARLCDTRTPQGIVAVVPMLPPSPAAAGDRCVYLYEVQDPGNLGTILRTLAWFGGLRCLLSPGSVDPYNAKVVRASLGALFHVPIETHVELAALRTRFARIAGLGTDSKPVQSPAFGEFACYAFGNEARGLPAELRDAAETSLFTIAGCGAIESLNLAAAVNICVYELGRGRIPL